MFTSLEVVQGKLNDLLHAAGVNSVSFEATHQRAHEQGHEEPFREATLFIDGDSLQDGYRERHQCGEPWLRTRK